MKRIEHVTVIGAGIMGTGIANTIFKHHIPVTLFDVRQNALTGACEQIRRQARRGMDAANIVMAESLADAVEGADLVIEAVFEDLALKCRLFDELNDLAPAHTVFASNTSSLSISAMAEAAHRPSRFLGLHFFNPAVIMRLVEVILTDDLDPGVLTAATAFLDDLKKTGVQCRESPGFVVNRILIPLVNECFHLLAERRGDNVTDTIAVANDIDAAVIKHMSLLMGPFDLADLTGIDTICNAAETIYEGFSRMPRYRPAPLLTRYRQDERLGRKTSRGVYFYGSEQNDPDLNPPLDEHDARLVRPERPACDATGILAVVVNECCRVLEEGLVHGPADIEQCMELGTRWPRGPFRLAAEAGLDNLRAALARRYAETNGNPRYETCDLLRSPSAAVMTYPSAKED